MAKAGTKITTTWILLSEAKARAVRALGSPKYAEGKLIEWLVAGKLRWRSEHLEGSKKETDPGSGVPEFFRDELVDIPSAPGDILVFIGPVHRLVINWDESWARRDRYEFYAIVVAEEDLTRLIAPDDVDIDVDVDATTFAKVWVPREARLLKRAGKLEQVRTQTELAELLRAVGIKKDLRKVSLDYIRDNLDKWGLWPISKIE